MLTVVQALEDNWCTGRRDFSLRETYQGGESEESKRGVHVRSENGLLATGLNMHLLYPFLYMRKSQEARTASGEK